MLTMTYAIKTHSLMKINYMHAMMIILRNVVN